MTDEVMILFIILIISVFGIFIIIYGIFNIVKGIMYYNSAEEMEATVVESYDFANARNALMSYKLSVEIEDNGEVITLPVENLFFLKQIEHIIKKGDKIMVWYIRKSKRCIADRSQPIKWGFMCIAIVVVLVFSLFAIKH